MAALRVVVADDSVLMRAGVVRVLDEAGFEVVGEVADAVRLMEVVAAQRPDVVVSDIRMPPTHRDEGIRAAREIRRIHPSVGVLVLSAYAEPEYVLELLEDGAAGLGYLLKDRVGDVEDFAAAIRRVAHGGTALEPTVVELMVSVSAQRALAERRSTEPPAAADMDALVLEHAVAWAREHGCGVAREVRDGFVAVTPDGRHSRHAHYWEALEWFDELGVESSGGG